MNKGIMRLQGEVTYEHVPYGYAVLIQDEQKAMLLTDILAQSAA